LMRGTNPSRFRPTVWPGGPIPCPKVLRTGTVLPASGRWGGDVIEYLVDCDTSEVELPDDFVLREIFEVDLTVEALAEFTGRWGYLTYWGHHRLSALPDGWVPGNVYSDLERLEPEIPDDGPRTTWMVPESAISLHVRALRIMADHLKVYFAAGTGDDYGPVWLAHGYPEAPRNEGQGWLWFDTLINAALRPCHAHVQFHPGGSLTGATPMPTLYQACALQLYNYVAEETPFGHCANERCGRLFTRQRGRAMYGQHRSTGVRFCSHSCAKAQGERERRRRLRQARTQSPN
jgi:hypothetical protein